LNGKNVAGGSGNGVKTGGLTALAQEGALQQSGILHQAT
jgi:hypothetical protein